jgi:hypothetical protein
VQVITANSKGPDLILFFSGYKSRQPVRNQELSVGRPMLLKPCAGRYIRVAEAAMSARYSSNSTDFSTPVVEKHGEGDCG